MVSFRVYLFWCFARFRALPAQAYHKCLFEQQEVLWLLENNCQSLHFLPISLTSHLTSQKQIEAHVIQGLAKRFFLGWVSPSVPSEETFNLGKTFLSSPGYVRWLNPEWFHCNLLFYSHFTCVPYIKSIFWKWHDIWALGDFDLTCQKIKLTHCKSH